MNATTTVSARVLNGGEWSALTVATFVVGTVPASAANLVVSEIHYHPAAPDATETAAGFPSRGDFEFVELTNIGTATVDLRDVTFTDGIAFAFAGSEVEELPPGARALVVANAAAFGLRYGAGLPVAGEFAGDISLSNGGETLSVAAGGEAILTFAYDDDPPWPTAPDGHGFSLVLMNPGDAPDHGDPASWRASIDVHGSPGAAEPTGTLATWLAGHGLNPALDPLSDEDHDGLALLVEFGSGGSPSASGDAPVRFGRGGNGYEMTYSRNKLATGALDFSVDFSSDLLTWIPAGPVVRVEEAGGSIEHVTVAAGVGGFYRLKVGLR